MLVGDTWVLLISYSYEKYKELGYRIPSLLSSTPGGYVNWYSLQGGDLTVSIKIIRAPFLPSSNPNSKHPVLAIYCVTNQPKTQWLETIYFYCSHFFMLTKWISLRVSHRVPISQRLGLWSSESLTGLDIQDGTPYGWQLVLAGSRELQCDYWPDDFTWPLHVNWLFIAWWLDSPWVVKESSLEQEGSTQQSPLSCLAGMNKFCDWFCPCSSAQESISQERDFGLAKLRSWAQPLSVGSRGEIWQK